MAVMIFPEPRNKKQQASTDKKQQALSGLSGAFQDVAKLADTVADSGLKAKLKNITAAGLKNLKVLKG